MPRKQPTVAILFNLTGEDEYEKLRDIDPSTLGFKPEYDIHVATSMEEYEALAKALRAEGFRVRLVNVEENLPRLLHTLAHRPPDVIFNLVEHFHNNPEREMDVAGVYELFRIPYTGAPPFGLAVCQRKGLTKKLLTAHGVPTPRARLLQTSRQDRDHGLRFPLIVKPGREDASSGVEGGSVVYNDRQLRRRIDWAFARFAPPILVEEYIDGRELHVSILGNGPPVVLPMIEFDFSALPRGYPRIISYAAKWDPLDIVFHRVHAVCPARLSATIRKKVEQMCLEAYRITGCRDYARIDVRLSPNGRAYVLEVNPNPDLTEGVSFMESAEKAGFSFPQTLRMIVEEALARRHAMSEPTGTGEPHAPSVR